jgi:multicomponent Na+:H+ antiporter subunit E
MLFGSTLLAIAWAALSGEFSLGSLVTGAALGYLVMLVLARGGVLPATFRGKVWHFVSLAGYLAYELVLANLRMAVDVVRWRSQVAPAVIRLPLDATEDGEILLLAALINLTPGSVALDLSDDRKTLYVHVMHVHDPDITRRDIKQGFERRVLKLLR